ncbi:MAG: hypothetical protein CMN78_00610 [Spirochaetales bacterium]|nr:hypothetical protein [Spirochaetales bacterium]
MKSTAELRRCAPNVLIIGAGMITYDLILPSVYHLQRVGVVGNITVCATSSRNIMLLKNSGEIANSFPGQDFVAMPSEDLPPEQSYPDLYREALADLSPKQIVIIAIPDQLHYRALMDSLDADQHILCVKPLVLTFAQAEEIRARAYDKGLFVGVEYHKRFDRRALHARKKYREGAFGEFVMGEAKLIEPYFYRRSNFQNWFTVENSDPFVYIGCHYVDQVSFITGLLPSSVSVSGVKRQFPNGNNAYMWANGRVGFENGGYLSVINGLGYPDDGAGSNEQCISLFCEGDGRTGMIKHNDQFRGVTHSYTDATGPGGTRFNFVSPDFFRLVPWDGDGAMPVGYGYDSIAANLNTIIDIERKSATVATENTLAVRQDRLAEVDSKGLLATPANSSYNELVTEAARVSIATEGAWVDIHYDEHPHIEVR